MEDSNQQPLLANNHQLVPEDPQAVVLVQVPLPSSFTADADAEDIPPILGFKDFSTQFLIETKKLWWLAGPAVFTTLCQYSLGAITQVFAGHIGTLELAAVSVENSVIAGFSFGVMLGMGSALETLCGQAYGAKQLDMLGIYMQRSWVILTSTAIILSFLYIFAGPFLELIGQKSEISRAAGTFSIWMIPQLFAYAANFPIAKFLQAQSKIMAMALISTAALVLHTFFSWLLMLKLKWGMVGAAVVLNSSWWFIVLGQLLYIFSGTCGQAWSGFSWKAFQNLWGFVRLSLASAVMLCLEIWYFMALIIFAGYLKNAEVSVDALSIRKISFFFGAHIAYAVFCCCSVRVSNELGAAHPRTAKFSVVVAVISSFLIGLVISSILLIAQNGYPALFSSDFDVKALVEALTPLLALSIVINNVQPVLSGVAIGAGWQAAVAYVNIGCYYAFGIPIGLVFGYICHFGVSGIWYGMLAGTILQTLVLFWMVYGTNWNKEASAAGERIRKWGGDEVSKEIDA
ncbi:Protein DETOXIFICATION 29 [Linum perenne]